MLVAWATGTALSCLLTLLRVLPKFYESGSYFFDDLGCMFLVMLLLRLSLVLILVCVLIGKYYQVADEAKTGYTCRSTQLPAATLSPEPPRSGSSLTEKPYL